jgi:hypothetical protein
MAEASGKAQVVGLWSLAVLGAVVVMTSPLTPWMVQLEVVGIVVVLVCTVGLCLRLSRR